jgi:predicted MPP superfamily phosphohydrolase
MGKERAVLRFILFFLLIYGSAHAYFFRKACRAFPLAAGKAAALTVLLIVLLSAPLLARSLEKSGQVTAATIASQIGYWWMGLLFLFISAAVLLDLCRLVAHLAGKTSQHPGLLIFSPRALFLLPSAYALLVGTYAWFEARDIRSEHITLISSKLPITQSKLRIVQISDVHIGQIVNAERVRRMVSLIRRETPDILVSTGDLVDGHQRHFQGIAPLFREIAPPFGTYAIPGNHEYYVGIDQALAFMKEAGFRVLRDESVVIPGLLTITGIDDPAYLRFGNQGGPPEGTLLARNSPALFTLLLKHRPIVAHGSPSHFDLQLSGHVHKGQLFPFNLLTWLHFPIRAGLTALSEGSAIYVSRGTGTWGPPLRFLAPPEITVIDLVPARGLQPGTR